MYKYFIFGALTLLIFSCKSNYTGFNAYNGRFNAAYTTLPPVSKLYANDDVIIQKWQVASTADDMYLPRIIETQNIEEKAFVSKIKAVNEVTLVKKVTFKEKVLTKIIDKKLKKSVLVQPDGFQNLDNKLKIGLILLAVAVGLSILGFGSLAGLAGLVGLIFLIIGLLNTYN